MSERRSTGPKLNPTLFDKLVVDSRALDLLEPGRAEIISLDTAGTQLNLGSAATIERFNEKALRGTIRRELNWLLNTTQLDAVQDLDAYPEVQTSVLNYGVPDMTGRASVLAAVQARTEQILEAIRRFEPRIDAQSLSVELGSSSRDHAVSFIIRGDIVAAIKAMPVQYVADLEAETGVARVHE